MARQYTKHHNESPIDRGTLITWNQIARYLGVSVHAARNWHRQHGLPVALLPDGRRMTTVSLIDAWVMARSPHINDLQEDDGATGFDQPGNNLVDQ